MKSKLIMAAVIVGSFALAGCGGGGNDTAEMMSTDPAPPTEEEERIAELEEELEEAQKDATEAKRLRQEEEEARQTAEQAQREAEEEKAELEEEARETARQALEGHTRRLWAGLGEYLTDTDPRVGTDVAVTPRYRANALVTTAPVVTFSSTETGTQGRWYRTSLSHRGGTDYDRVDVYTDAEAPSSVPFRESSYNEEGPDTDVVIVGRYNPEVSDPMKVIDDNQVVGSIQISTTNGPANRQDTTSSAFPSSGAPAKPFDQIDRGQYTTADRAADAMLRTMENFNPGDIIIPDGYTGLYRNLARHPLQFTYETNGRLAEASGTFTCASATEMSCRVTNEQGHFRFVGPWVFTPLSASASIRVKDSEFMYFGWWAQQANADRTWKFRTFHGPAGTSATDVMGNRSTFAEISQLTGSATYQGIAVGQFAYYQPFGGGLSAGGEFNARATLAATFGASPTVRGTIDQFDDYPDWTLTLKQGDIVNSDGATTGVAENGVSWQIEGEAVAAPDAGSWEAAFYSNLPSEQRTSDDPADEDAVPTGIAGTFEAAYRDTGRMIGAFGAHKQ